MSGETRPYDRHTQGTYWHMRTDTLALASDTLALATDTLALTMDTLAHTRLHK